MIPWSSHACGVQCGVPTCASYKVSKIFCLKFCKQKKYVLNNTCCCPLALIAVGKEVVLMHGLHKCLFEEDKGQPSAVNLHSKQ